MITLLIICNIIRKPHKKYVIKTKRYHGFYGSTMVDYGSTILKYECEGGDEALFKYQKDKLKNVQGRTTSAIMM